MRPETAIDVGMPIPAQVARFVFSGQLFGGEIWASGFYADVGPLANPAAATTLAQSMTSLLKDSGSTAAMANQASKTWSTQTAWLYTTVYYYGPGGPHASLIGEYTLPTALVGSASGGVPNQCSSVVSLRTATPGRGYRGRMYMPLTAGISGASGQLGSSDVTSLATGWAAAFTAMKTSLSAYPVVVSAHNSAKTTITSVIVTSKADTQRRRANKEALNATVSKPVT